MIVGGEEHFSDHFLLRPCLFSIFDPLNGDFSVRMWINRLFHTVCAVVPVVAPTPAKFRAGASARTLILLVTSVRTARALTLIYICALVGIIAAAWDNLTPLIAFAELTKEFC